MYKIEFNDEMTVESIMSSFKNLADSKIDCYIEIGDTIIKGDEEDLLVKVTKAYKEYMKNRTSQEEKREINVQTDIRTWDPKDIKEYNDLFNQRNDVYLLRENMVFTFQLGIISKYVKKEYVEKLKEFYCGVYGQAWEIKCSNCENALNSTRYMHYVSTLLLILEDSECSAVQKQLKIQQIINGIENNRSELCRFTIAVEDVIRYGLRGEELKSYMSVGILEEEFEKKDAAWEQFALEMKDKYRG